MSTIVRYSNGSTYTIVPNKVDIEKVQDLDGQYHIPFSSIVGMMRLGLGIQKITVSGDALDMSACLWHDVVAISFDSGTSYQAVYFAGVPYTSDCWSGIYPYALSLLASPLREGAAVRYPASGYKWGNQSIAGISQAGNVSAFPTIHFLAPLFYAPLSNTLIDFAGQAVAFERFGSKVHAGVTYPSDTPIFDNGLYIGSDTAQDFARWTPPVSTVRTVVMQIKKTNAVSWDFSIWANAVVARNNVLIDTSNNLIKWSDGTTTVSAVFPTAAYLSGAVTDIVLIEDTSHAVTVAVHAAGGSWTSATGTLAALLWNSSFILGQYGDGVTRNPLEGSISNLIQYGYVLSSAEYQALAYSSLSLLFNGLYIGNRYAGEIVKGSDRRLVNANSSDISALLGGSDIAIGSAAVTIAQSQGLSARWYVEVKRTDV